MALDAAAARRVIEDNVAGPLGLHIANNINSRKVTR